MVPASDTGAVEMAMWSLLGERGVDVLAWESFGAAGRLTRKKQLRLKDARLSRGAEYGRLAELSQLERAHDVVFAWNGTTSGVRVPMATGFPPTARGWRSATPRRPSSRWTCLGKKLDVVTWSWQKVLGGEARTACWRYRRARWSGSRPTRRSGRCRRFSG